MKKHVVLLCTLTLVASLAACGAEEEEFVCAPGLTKVSLSKYPNTKKFSESLCACPLSSGKRPPGDACDQIKAGVVCTDDESEYEGIEKTTALIYESDPNPKVCD